MTRRPDVSGRRAIAGGSGSAAGVEAVLPRPGAARRALLNRLLEDERSLAYLLLTPTIVLLGLFIAYPFVLGTWLSVSSATVGVAGHFVGLKNFAKAWDDSIFRTAAFNTFLYTGVTTVFKLALGI